MQCANPQCRRSAKNLSTGTLRMLEMEVAPEKRVVRAESGFPVIAVPARFFWMCETCSLTLKIRRWTAAGLIFELLPGRDAAAARIPPSRAKVPAHLQKLSPGAA